MAAAPRQQSNEDLIVVPKVGLAAKTLPCFATGEAVKVPNRLRALGRGCYIGNSFPVKIKRDRMIQLASYVMR